MQLHKEDLISRQNEWLTSSGPYQYYVTLTVKQGLKVDGVITGITYDECAKVARIFRNNLKTRCFPRRPYNWLTFIEGIDRNSNRRQNLIKRAHIHFVIQCPRTMTQEQLTEAVCRVAAPLDWIHNKIDVRPITKTPERLISYNSKEGSDAFCPEASCIHSPDWA